MKKNTSQSVASRPSSGGSLRFSPGQFNRSLHRQCRSLALPQVLGFVRRRVGRQWGFAEVVGQWVWVHASDTLTELERSMLFELGFHWSARRRAWQHPCGVFQSPASRQPFVRYFPAEEESRSPEFAPQC